MIQPLHTVQAFVQIGIDVHLGKRDDDAIVSRVGGNLEIVQYARFDQNDIACPNGVLGGSEIEIGEIAYIDYIKQFILLMKMRTVIDIFRYGSVFFQMVIIDFRVYYHNLIISQSCQKCNEVWQKKQLNYRISYEIIVLLKREYQNLIAE